MQNRIIFSEKTANRTMIERNVRYEEARRIVSGKNVLEIGCAARNGAVILAETAKQVTAIDINEDQVKWARAHYPGSNITYLVGDVQALPFPDRSFEAVTCLDVIEHVPQYQEALGEAHRVLADQGILFLTTPNKKRHADDGIIPNDHHFHEFTLEELKHELQDCGFTILEVSGFSWERSLDKKSSRIFSLVRRIDVFQVRKILGSFFRGLAGTVVRRASGEKTDSQLTKDLYAFDIDTANADYFFCLSQKK